MNPLLLLIPILGLGAYALTTASKASAQSKEQKKPTKAKEEKAKAVAAAAAAKRKYAQRLLSYVNGGGTNKRKIKLLQRKIGAKTTGKPDTQTEKKIEQILGYDVSWKPKKKVVKPKVYTSAKKPTVTAPKPVRQAGPLEQILSTLTKAPPKAASIPTPVKATPAKTSQTATPKLLPATTSRAPQFTSIPAAVPDSVIAATAIDGYLRGGGLNRTRIKDYQRRMGGLAIDGVPGPLTKARAETLLHRSISWPAQNAAEDLRNYYRGGGRDRTKIMAFQNAMGELTVDGLVGAKTKARYKTLTGKTW